MSCSKEYGFGKCDSWNVEINWDEILYNLLACVSFLSPIRFGNVRSFVSEDGMKLSAWFGKCDKWNVEINWDEILWDLLACVSFLSQISLRNVRSGVSKDGMK